MHRVKSNCTSYSRIIMVGCFIRHFGQLFTSNKRFKWMQTKKTSFIIKGKHEMRRSTFVVTTKG